MATNENLIPIPGRLHSVASDEIVSGANEIYDDKLSDNQENLNSGFTNDIDTIYNTIGDDNEKGAIMEQLNTIDGRLDTIDGEISALNSIPIEIVQLNPSTEEPNVNNPKENTLYRAYNSDHTQYSDWMYKNGSWTMITQQLEPTSQEKLVGYYTCNTAANTPGKEVTTGNSGYVLPTNGGAMKIKMTKVNTANNVTLKIGTETAKTLLYNGETVSASNTWEEGEVISVFFDGTNYQASNAQGGSNKKIDAYLYGDTKVLSVGKLYKEGEEVSTVDKQLLVLTKDIKVLNLTDEIEAGDLRVYNNKTYLASEDVSPYSNATPYSDGDYALGRPSKMLITVDISDMSVSEATTISISVGGTTSSIDINPGDTAQAIAGRIVAALTYITDWTISYNSEGVVTLKCKTGGANTLAFSYSDTGSTGIVVTSSATAGANTVSVYTSDGDVWAAATLANYVISTVWGDRGSDNYLSIAELQEAATAQNSITKELNSIKSSIDAMVSPKKRVDVILRTTTSGESSDSNIEKAQLETNGNSITGPLLPADMEFDEDIIITVYGKTEYGSVTFYDENLTQLYKKKGTSASYIGTRDTHWTPEQFKALIANYPTIKYIKFKWGQTNENNIVGHYTVLDRGDSIVAGARKLRNVLGNVTNTSNIFWNVKKPSDLDRVDRILVKAFTGNVNLYKITVNGSTATPTFIDTITVPSVRNGDVFEYDCNIELAANEYIGYNCNAKMFLNNFGSSVSGLGVSYCPIEGGTINSSTYRNSCELGVQYIKYGGVGIAKFTADIEQLREDADELRTDVDELRDDVDELSALAQTPTNVLFSHNFSDGTSSFITGTQNVENGALVVAEGHTLNKTYCTEERELTFWIKFGATSVARFGYDMDTLTLADRGLIIDIPNMKIRYNPYNNNVHYDLEHMDTSHEYIVSIIKDYQDRHIRLVDLTDGNIETHTWLGDGTGSTGPDAVPRTPGTQYVTAMWGKPRFDLGGGAPYQVKKIMMITKQCNFNVILYGDSITEQENYWPKSVFDKSWTQLIINKVKENGGRACSSAWVGKTIADLSSWIRNDLPYVRAKYVMITIGTNGGNTEANLSALVEYIKSCGAIPLLNHVPCRNAGDQVAKNAMIDTVRARYNIKGCDFDKCTSLAGDGVNYDPDKMWHDNGGTWHHPNVAGSLAMFAQTLIDVPEIYG